MSKIINGVDVTTMMQTMDAVKADPTVAKFRFRLHNEWVGRRPQPCDRE